MSYEYNSGFSDGLGSANQKIAEITKQRDELKAALHLLYSWANNWDSEFMNDPDWKNKDVLIIQEALKESA